MFSNYERKAALALVVVLLLALANCRSTSSSSARQGDDPYEDGYRDGYNDGYDEGQSSGYDNGVEDGFYEGVTHACLFYRDVDKAFQTAQKGCAWETFVSAYDRYIADIYHTEEEASALEWALIDATSSDGGTAQEASLLVKAFGRELFTRNGVSLP